MPRSLTNDQAELINNSSPALQATDAGGCLKEALEGGGGSGSFIWKGELATAPTDPVVGWAYFNTADQKSYYYSGTAWDDMSAEPGGGVEPTMINSKLMYSSTEILKYNLNVDSSTLPGIDIFNGAGAPFKFMLIDLFAYSREVPGGTDLKILNDDENVIANVMLGSAYFTRMTDDAAVESETPRIFEIGDALYVFASATDKVTVHIVITRLPAGYTPIDA